MYSDKYSRDDISAILALSELLSSISYSKDKILTVATCSDVELIAPEIWQKFDLYIEIPMPNIRTRLHILRNLVAIVPSDLDLTEIIDQTEGFSYTDLQRLVWNAIIEKTSDINNIKCPV